MPSETEKPITAPRSCRECEHWHEMKQKLRISQLLANVIEGMEAKLKSSEFKPTLSEYVKLLQLEKELEEGAPTEIKVTWVDPALLSSTEK